MGIYVGVFFIGINGRQLFKCMYLSAAHKEIDCLVALPLPALC